MKMLKVYSAMNTKSQRHMEERVKL